MHFRRSKDSIIGGVCGGLEDSTNISAIAWRIGFILIPSAAWIYIIIWALTEEE